MALMARMGALLGRGDSKKLSKGKVRRTRGSEPSPETLDHTGAEASEEVAAPSAWPRVSGPADAVLYGTLIALIAFGVVMVYSASSVFAAERYDDGYFFLIRQGIFALIALPLIVALARIDYHHYRRFTYPLLALVVGLLLYVVLGFGHTAGGAARWISVGPVHIQPAEMAKVAVIFWLAYSLSKKREKIRTFSVGFLPHFLMSGFLMLLCLRQPDFGSAVMIGALTFVLLFTAGAKLGYILGTGLLALPVVYGLIANSAYRMRRIQAFLDPFEHRRGAGYQVAESLLSFGSGGIGGVGIGDSQQKLFFLPEAHTDFISAIIGEELGLVGIVTLVLAFLLVFARGIRTAFRAVDEYGTYLAVGITMFIGMQAFTNLAVAMGMLPTKGLVLPFISYGGSSLLVNSAAVGVLLNISRPRVSQLEAQSSPELAEKGRPDSSKNRSRRSQTGTSEDGTLSGARARPSTVLGGTA